MDLRGKVAVVSGASRGLGREIAQLLASRGARLAVTARNVGQLDQLAREIRKGGGDAMSIAIDVSNWKYVERGMGVIRNHFGVVDILVNVAGQAWGKPFQEWTADELDLAVDVNLKGAIYMSRAVIEDMLENGDGRIVNVVADRSDVEGAAACTGGRQGMVAFSQALERELANVPVMVLTLTGSPTAEMVIAALESS